MIEILNNGEMLKHILNSYPNEACGLVYNNKYRPCKNISETPTTGFKINSKDYVKAETSKTKLQAVIHSHPITKDTNQQIHLCTPSAADHSGQRTTNVPWAIIATDGFDVTPPLWFPGELTRELYGREFIHGVADCYTIWRDYYYQKFNITMQNYPRDYEWWNTEENLYLDNYESEGFRVISPEEIKEGDVILMKILSKNPNHAAIYLGNDKIIHHLAGRISGEDSYKKWKRQITHILRHSVND